MVDGLRWRRLVVGVLAWLLFGACWGAVLLRQQQGLGEDLMILPVTAAVALIGTLGWQSHNRALHRRRGARRAAHVVDEPWTRDRLGRSLEFSDSAAAAREVVISLPAPRIKSYGAAR